MYLSHEQKTSTAVQLHALMNVCTYGKTDSVRYNFTLNITVAHYNNIIITWYNWNIIVSTEVQNLKQFVDVLHVFTMFMVYIH